MTTPPLIRRYLVALRALAVLTLVLGVAYPLVITGIARLVFPGNADGSLLHHDGRTVGSALIGQKFTRPVTKDGRPERDADGTPVLAADPRYFQSRPSAAGNGYDPLSTSASNLGPDSSARRRRADACPRGRAHGERVGPGPADKSRLRPRADRQSGPGARLEPGAGRLPRRSPHAGPDLRFPGRAARERPRAEPRTRCRDGPMNDAGRPVPGRGDEGHRKK